MDRYTIIATPEELLSSSAEITKKASMIQTVLANIRNEIKKTSSFWIGDAADLQRSVYNEQIPEMEQMVGILNDQANMLKHIAGNYAAAKGYAASLVETLPDNVIS